MKKTRLIAGLLVTMLLTLALALPAVAQVEPPTVVDELAPGGSMTLTKEVTTPPIPPVVDICLLEDETGSFGDDIANLQGGTTASDIYDAIVAESPNAQFAVAGFRDYEPPWGSAGDWVFRVLSNMSELKANWLAGIAALTAGGGGDTPEAQYDAIVAATTSVNWRDPAVTPGVQRVLVVTTDAPFHLPGDDKPHVNTEASTITALQAQNIIVIGLKAPGSGAELDALAAATGGSTQALSSNGEDIAQAILDGLAELTTDVWWEVVECDPGLIVTLDPVVHEDIPGNTTVVFEETIALTEDAEQCHTLNATVVFIANEYPEEGEVIGEQEIHIHVADITPPVVGYREWVNPHGSKVPPAGWTTLPGTNPNSGMNPDGFYQLGAWDNCDLDPEIFVSDLSVSVVFGPFPHNTVVKITEDPDAAPECKKIGSSKGRAGAVDYHIILPTDAVIWAVDDYGNMSTVLCLVPPPPK
jgi:hypothetical protein